MMVAGFSLLAIPAIVYLNDAAASEDVEELARWVSQILKKKDPV